jgi:hypothetical protein
MHSHLANGLIYVDTTNPKPRELETVCGGVRLRYAFVVWLLFLIRPLYLMVCGLVRLKEQTPIKRNVSNILDYVFNYY